MGLYAAFGPAATTGLRRGEVPGLRWSIDVELSQVAVNQTPVTVEVRASTPKSAKGRRSVDLDSGAARVLREHAGGRTEDIEAIATGVWDLVSMVRLVGRYTPTPSRNPSGYVAEAALPRLRLHDLRHTRATLTLKSGRHAKVSGWGMQPWSSPGCLLPRGAGDAEAPCGAVRGHGVGKLGRRSRKNRTPGRRELIR